MKKTFITFGTFLLPAVALAQSLGNLQNLLTAIGNLVTNATPIVVGLALLGFFWGLAMYIFSAGSDEKKKEGKNIMIWGVVALFVMVSIWGLVKFIGDALGINQGTTIIVPRV